METFTLKDANDNPVEIPLAQLVAFTKDFTDGYKEGFKEAFTKAATKSATLTLAFCAVGAIGGYALVQASKRHDRIHNKTSDTE